MSDNQSDNAWYPPLKNEVAKLWYCRDCMKVLTHKTCRADCDHKVITLGKTLQMLYNEAPHEQDH